MSEDLKLFGTIPYHLVGLNKPFYNNKDLEREISTAYSSTQEMMADIISIEHDGINKTIYIYTHKTEKETVSIRKPLMGLEFTFLI
jgi:hypothetical protein